jgi:4-methylaminobutanoate oxidase (formaldehyde-forming)
VIRQAEDSFLIVTGSGQGVRDAAWIRRHVGDAFVVVDDVTSAWAVLSVMGPKAAAVLAGTSSDVFADATFPLGVTARSMSASHASVPRA